MKNPRVAAQENLFGSSRSREMWSRVKELDTLIARALKENDYDRAKKLTDQQARLIQELVVLGESGVGSS